MKPTLSQQLSELNAAYDLIDPIYYGLSERETRELRIRRNHIENLTGWAAKGPMQRVIGNVARELVLPTIKEWVPLLGVEAKLVERLGERIVTITGFTDEHGEIMPHGSGRFYSEPRNRLSTLDT